MHSITVNVQQTCGLTAWLCTSDTMWPVPLLLPWQHDLAFLSTTTAKSQVSCEGWAVISQITLVVLLWAVVTECCGRMTEWGRKVSWLNETERCLLLSLTHRSLVCNPGYCLLVILYFYICVCYIDFITTTIITLLVLPISLLFTYNYHSVWP